MDGEDVDDLFTKSVRSSDKETVAGTKRWPAAAQLSSSCHWRVLSREVSHHDGHPGRDGQRLHLRVLWFCFFKEQADFCQFKRKPAVNLDGVRNSDHGTTVQIHLRRSWAGEQQWEKQRPRLLSVANARYFCKGCPWVISLNLHNWFMR